MRFEQTPKTAVLHHGGRALLVATYVFAASFLIPELKYPVRRLWTHWRSMSIAVCSPAEVETTMSAAGPYLLKMSERTVQPVQ